MQKIIELADEVSLILDDLRVDVLFNSLLDTENNKDIQLVSMAKSRTASFINDGVISLRLEVSKLQGELLRIRNSERNELIAIE